MKVLHVTPSFYPATYWGGPIVSVHALCNGLAALPDISLNVLTTDAAGPARNDRLELAQPTTTYPAGYPVTFSRRLVGRDIAPGLVTRLPGLVRRADIVHLTGTYSFPTLPVMLACRAFRKPLVWSPRGALQASAEWQSSALKSLFEAACRLAMPQNTALHCTAEVERDMSLKRIPMGDAFVLPNGIDVPPRIVPRPFPDDRLNLMFLSRIDPKKGLEILLDALLLLPDSVHLDIYGTGDAAYRTQLAARIDAMGLARRVRCHGEVLGAAKAEAFAKADMFILPSHSENFGIVIAEALAHGVPVITTHNTPWAGLEARDCGRWIENTPAELASAITGLRLADRVAMGQRGRSWMQESFDWNTLSRAMSVQYQRLIDKGAGR